MPSVRRMAGPIGSIPPRCGHVNPWTARLTGRSSPHKLCLCNSGGGWGASQTLSRAAFSRSAGAQADGHESVRTQGGEPWTKVFC
jgi:hypothetical protein